MPGDTKNVNRNFLFFLSFRVLGFGVHHPTWPLFRGEGPLTLSSDLEAGGFGFPVSFLGGGYGLQTGFAAGRWRLRGFPYSGIPPTAGLCTVLRDSVLFAAPKPPPSSWTEEGKAEPGREPPTFTS